MVDSIIPTGGVAEANQFIADCRQRIADRRRELHEKIQRIRQRAKADEIYETDRAYSEMEPVRRQMEAMIQNVASIEALKSPAPVIMPNDQKPL